MMRSGVLHHMGSSIDQDTFESVDLRSCLRTGRDSQLGTRSILIPVHLP